MDICGLQSTFLDDQFLQLVIEGVLVGDSVTGGFVDGENCHLLEICEVGEELEVMLFADPLNGGDLLDLDVCDVVFLDNLGELVEGVHIAQGEFERGFMLLVYLPHDLFHPLFGHIHLQFETRVLSIVAYDGAPRTVLIAAGEFQEPPILVLLKLLDHSGVQTVIFQQILLQKLGLFLVGLLLQSSLEVLFDFVFANLHRFIPRFNNDGDTVLNVLLNIE